MQISDSAQSAISSSVDSAEAPRTGPSKVLADSTMAISGANPHLSKLLISSSTVSAESSLPSPLYASVTDEKEPTGSKRSSSGPSPLAAEVSLPLSPTSPVGGGSIEAVSSSTSTSNAEMDEDSIMATAVPSSPSPKKKISLASQPTSAVRKCAYCGVTSTPMWRHGPGDFTNLCNSCGVKWRRGKILSTGDNRHHLCKSGSSSSKKQNSLSNKESSPAAVSSTATAVSAGEKRKASIASFDNWADDAEWDLPRTRKARSCAKKLWSGRSLSSSDVEDCSIATAVETATKLGGTEMKGDSKRRQSKGFLESFPYQENPSSSFENPNSTLSHDVSSSTQSKMKSSSTSFSVSASQLYQTKVSSTSLSSVAVSLSNPASASSKLLSLTAEFAHLLDLLNGDSVKTRLFTSLLVQDFEDGMKKAYESGEEIELSVLDIRPKTWDLLRAIVL